MDLNIKRANKISCKDWIFTSNSSQVITAHLVKDIVTLDDFTKIMIDTVDGKALVIDKSDFLLSA